MAISSQVSADAGFPPLAPGVQGDGGRAPCQLGFQCSDLRCQGRVGHLPQCSCCTCVLHAMWPVM